MDIRTRLQTIVDRLRPAVEASAEVMPTASVQPPTVSAQILRDDAAGAAGQSTGILEISGFLDRRTYLEVAAAASEMIGAGVRRAGLIVDSGGGELAGLDGAVRALIELRRALGGELYAFAARTAASAAYPLLASGGRGKVFAAAGAMVGSVKALIRAEDDSALWRDAFLTTVHQLTAGAPLKNIGAPGVEITPEQIEHLERQVSSADAALIALAAAARGTSAREMARMAGEGGILEASLARQAGLIDGVLDEPAFRALVAGAATPQPLPQEIDDMPEDTTEAQDSASPPEAAEKPPEPAKPPAVKAAEPPPAAASSDLEKVVSALAGQVQTLATALDQDRQARATADRARAADSLVARIEARIGNPITATAAEKAAASVRNLVAAGATEAAEQVVAALEDIPSALDEVALTEEITFAAGDGDSPVSFSVDMTQFGVTPGPDGRPRVNRAAAIETAGLLHGAESDRDRFRRLEAAFRRDGRY